VQHGTLHGLCEHLRRLAPQVVPPVHRFDLAPQVMQGLFAVALVTRQGHVKVVYGSAGEGQRRLC